MKNSFFRVIVVFTLGFIFSTSYAQDKKKKQSKEQIMATIICECLENEKPKNLENKFKEKLDEFFQASVLGALLAMVPTDKDSTININSDGTSNQITEDDKKKALILLEKNCDVYKTYNVHSKAYSEALIKVSDGACKCIAEIPTSISTEEKNNLITDCISKSAVNEGAIETMKLDTVEAMKGFLEDIQRVLVDNCESLKKVTFSNDEEKLYSYSVNEDAGELYNQGIAASEKGNYKKALKLYKKAVALDEKFVFAWDNLGRTYRQLHDYDNAIKAYKKSIAIDPLNPTPMINMAVAYGYKKDFKNSKYWYNKLIEAYPKDPEGHYGLALAYLNLNELESSLTSVIRAYKLYKESNSPYVADSQKVMKYLKTLFKEQNKTDIFEKICKEQNIKL